MKDWKEQLEGLDDSLADWRKRFLAAHGALVAKRKGAFGFWKQLSPDVLETVARQAEEEVGEGPHAEVSGFLDSLSDYFVEANIAERCKVRAYIGQSDTLSDAVQEYARNSAEYLGKDGETRLRRGLSALAIDDVRMGVDHVWGVLAEFWVGAQRAGIDPKPIFEEVAKVANRSAAGGGAHMRELLADFDHSVIFREQVAPQLERQRRAS